MKNIVYLKANNIFDFSIPSIQKWIDVFVSLSYEIIIICDNDSLNMKLNKLIEDQKNNIILIKSLVEKVENISKEICKPEWINASNANLSIFYHALENHYDKFWMIDADDTYFCLNTEEIAKSIVQVEEYSKKTKMQIMGFDMWWTIYGNKNWTFGVTYINHDISHLWKKIIKHYKDFEYKNITKMNFQIDSFFEYLRIKNVINFGTYYIKNSTFIHWRVAKTLPLTYNFYDGIVVFPNKLYFIFSNTFKSGKVKIHDSVIAIDIDISRNNNKNIYNDKYLKTISKTYNKNTAIEFIKTLGFKNFLYYVLRLTKKER